MIAPHCQRCTRVPVTDVAKSTAQNRTKRSSCGTHRHHIYDYYGHMQGVVRKIQLKDAKARLSAVVDQATRGKPSLITRHGKPEAVVLGFADWERLSRVPSFGRLLMSAPLEPGDLPDRNRAPMRDAGL